MSQDIIDLTKKLWTCVTFCSVRVFQTKTFMMLACWESSKSTSLLQRVKLWELLFLLLEIQVKFRFII